MDCSIHNKANAKEGLICYTFSSPSANAFSYKKGYTTEEQDVVSKINRKKIQWKGYKIDNYQNHIPFLFFYLMVHRVL